MDPLLPRQSATTHTEILGDEASVYDWRHTQVHALNPTAARVWRLCDGATSPDAIAAVLRQEMGIPEAEALVDLTLEELARLHLLEQPVESRADRPAPTRRWLLGRGLAAAMLPTVYTILTPSPLEAQSAGAAPTLSSVTPNQGTQGTTVAVTLAGTNFVVSATTVNVSGGGVTVDSVVVGSTTSLTANLVLDGAAAAGARTVTVTTAGGTSGGQTFTINLPAPLAPTLVSVTPNQGQRGTTVAVTLVGTNFVVSATTVNVSGTGVTVDSVVVGSTTSLTANFVLDGATAAGARTVTVTTAGGTSGGQTFTITLPPPGSQAFAFTGAMQVFAVPVGVTTLTVTARGAQGGAGVMAAGGLGGSVTATLPVVGGEAVNVRVGGQGQNYAPGPGTSGAGGFNGGGTGGTALFAGGGGGASDLRRGGDALSNRVLVAGGGGGAGSDSAGGSGGGLTGGAGAGSPAPSLVTGGGGGTQAAGGAAGVNPGNALLNGQPGASGTGGAGGNSVAAFGGGGAGAGYFGGGGGGVEPPPGQVSGAGGGGGSSFADPAATGVVHTQGDRPGDGAVIINW